MLALNEAERAKLWKHLVYAIETYTTGVQNARVAPELDLTKVRELIRSFTFEVPRDPIEAINFVLQGLWQQQVHTPHPRYFGLFNPAATTMGIAADMLVAAFNPQLAAWSHAPFAAEIEVHLVRKFGECFGYDSSAIDGTFTSGGAEANHTAILTALVEAFPDFPRKGLRGLHGQPRLYVSEQTHHSILKAARFCGLGTDAVQKVGVNERRQMDPMLLASQIVEDRAAGFLPFLVIATAGSTNAGTIDPLVPIADVAAKQNLWLHVDAAWGGAAMLVPELRPLLAGIERADSITFDTHKQLSVPMAAGLYLTRHPDVLGRTCTIAADYMPRDARDLDIVDPFVHSLQWSRRFIGLKVFMSLAVAGWQGYENALRHQTAMGERLRTELIASRWKIINDTKLPVVCFVDEQKKGEGSSAYVNSIAQMVISSGRAWISTTQLGNTSVLRACITNYRTRPDDIAALVEALNTARQQVATRAPAPVSA